MYLRILMIIGAFCCFIVKGKAQNTPVNNGLPSDPVTGAITYPPNLNASPNSTPTFYNYKRVYTPLKAMQTVPAFNLTNGQPILVNTEYGDGLGNKLMTIDRTNLNGDIITPGDVRTSKTQLGYLPYIGSYNDQFQPAVYSTQKQQYASQFFLEGATAYSKSVIGTDPTTGASFGKSFMPGKAYVGQQRGVTKKSTIYEGSEILVLVESSGTLCRNGTYPAGSLVVTTETDPEKEAASYTDKSGRIICKKSYLQNKTVTQYTYYVYNEMGKLAYIVPPLASAQLISNSCIANLDKLCFTYTYDAFGNVIEKGTPGKSGKEYIVYDRLHRPVLTQTPLMAAQSKWNFILYDTRGRVAMTGKLTAALSSGYSRSWFQSRIDDHVPQSNTSVTYYFDKPINGTYPSSLTNCDIEIINYYDSYTGVAASTIYDNSFASEFLTGDIAEAPSPYSYAYGRLVASKRKVVNPGGFSNSFVNSWITSVFFYDEKGRLIQTQTLNPWSPANTWDVTALQYDYLDHVIYSIGKHHGPGEAKNETEMRVKNIYNSQTAKLMEVWQQLDNEPWQPIRKYQYDAFGRVVHKWIGGTEEQDFTYDINGRTIGVNEAYINSANTAFTPTRTFAEKLSFEQGFTDRRFDGSLSGFRWRTAGGSVNAYGYSYDDMGRMTAADFRENITPNSSPTWSKAAKDFSVADISYDANGNMLTMKQYGYNTSLQPDLIDDLTYQYTTNTNQLASVTDAGVASPIRDFNNNAGNTASYQYDANGNLAADNLKGIALGYNFRDQPLRVLKGVDEIQNIYDAGGTLLHKNITEAGLPVTYSYWGPFVYRNDTLLYVLHPEGRCRWVNDTGVFRYDYFIKDHIGNVRTTITTDAASLSTYYLATHEVASAHLEEQIFGNINEVRDVRPGGTPGDVDAAELDGRDPDRRIGTSLLVHVMAGDNISLQGYSYHLGTDIGKDDIAKEEDMANALISTLSGGVGGFDGGEAGNGVDFVNALFPAGGGYNYSVYESLKQGNTDPSNPRAYLNYLFFDEGLKLVAEESGVIQVSGTANSWEQISLPGLPVNATGYFLVYVSNEQGQPVWFDNLAITYTKGRLLEEQNYYPHGLLSQSSTTAGVDPENQYKHQGKLLQEELGMQLYDFHARQYDPQIGRFWSIDPLDEFASGYTGMGNNPANLTDPTGMRTQTYNGQEGTNIPHWESYDLLSNIGLKTWHISVKKGGNGGSGRGSSGPVIKIEGPVGEPFDLYKVFEHGVTFNSGLTIYSGTRWVNGVKQEGVWVDYPSTKNTDYWGGAEVPKGGEELKSIAMETRLYEATLKSDFLSEEGFYSQNKRYYNSGTPSVTTKDERELIAQRNLKVTKFSSTTVKGTGKYGVELTKDGAYKGTSVQVGNGQIGVGNDGSVSYGVGAVTIGCNPTTGDILLEISVPTGFNTSLGIGFSIDSEQLGGAVKAATQQTLWIISTVEGRPIFVPVFR